MSGFTIIALTALCFAAIGIFLSRGKIHTVEDFSLSRNTLKPWSLSLTLFATGMGVWILFGPAEALLAAGVVALFFYALSSTLSLWIFAILGKKIRETLPHGTSLVEFVLQRFGVWMYLLVLIVTFIYMALAMTAELTGIGLASELLFGTPAWQTILMVGICTMAYTALGGFRASVATDKVQTLVILPLFALLVVVGVVSNGTDVLGEAVMPTLSGFEYGIALLIGVLSAEAFNQVWWQRVYSSKTTQTMQKGFFTAGAMVFPVVFIAGLLGLYGLAQNPDINPSVAVFGLFQTLPPWLMMSTLVLAVSLMMSSMDSLLSGMASILTYDARRLKPQISEKRLVTVAKVLTVLFALGSMLVATQGFSVLYLFLVADLICAGIAFPVFYGLFSKRVGRATALIASAAGILGGALLFPDPTFTHGTLIGSFSLAFFLPIAITLLFEKKGDSLN